MKENGEKAENVGTFKAKRFDLEERTVKFGEAVIEFLVGVKRNAVTSPLISQVVRSATSIGANYCEADQAGSRKEFKYRVSICGREARETKYWLRMLAKAVPDAKETARSLWQEADELTRIFATIHRNTKDEKEKRKE